MTFYHGTSSELVKLGDRLLPPGETGVLREVGRQKNLDVVFATSSLSMAVGYANTTARNHGGDPVIYKVSGKFRPWKNKVGTTIFVASVADIVEKI